MREPRKLAPLLLLPDLPTGDPALLAKKMPPLTDADIAKGTAEEFIPRSDVPEEVATHLKEALKREDQRPENQENDTALVNALDKVLDGEPATVNLNIDDFCKVIQPQLSIDHFNKLVRIYYNQLAPRASYVYATFSLENLKLLANKYEITSGQWQKLLKGNNLFTQLQKTPLTEINALFSSLSDFNKHTFRTALKNTCLEQKQACFFLELFTVTTEECRALIAKTDLSVIKENQSTIPLQSLELIFSPEVDPRDFGGQPQEWRFAQGEDRWSTVRSFTKVRAEVITETRQGKDIMHLYTRTGDKGIHYLLLLAEVLTQGDIARTDPLVFSRFMKSLVNMSSPRQEENNRWCVFKMQVFQLLKISITLRMVQLRALEINGQNTTGYQPMVVLLKDPSLIKILNKDLDFFILLIMFIAQVYPKEQRNIALSLLESNEITDLYRNNNHFQKMMMCLLLSQTPSKQTDVDLPPTISFPNGSHKIALTVVESASDINKQWDKNLDITTVTQISNFHPGTQRDTLIYQHNAAKNPCLCDTKCEVLLEAMSSLTPKETDNIAVRELLIERFETHPRLALDAFLQQATNDRRTINLETKLLTSAHQAAIRYGDIEQCKQLLDYYEGGIMLKSSCFHDMGRQHGIERKHMKQPLALVNKLFQREQERLGLVSQIIKFNPKTECKTNHNFLRVLQKISVEIRGLDTSVLQSIKTHLVKMLQPEAYPLSLDQKLTMLHHLVNFSTQPGRQEAPYIAPNDKKTLDDIADNLYPEAQHSSNDSIKLMPALIKLTVKARATDDSATDDSKPSKEPEKQISLVDSCFIVSPGGVPDQELKNMLIQAVKNSHQHCEPESPPSGYSVGQALVNSLIDACKDFLATDFDFKRLLDILSLKDVGCICLDDKVLDPEWSRGNIFNSGKTTFRKYLWDKASQVFSTQEVKNDLEKVDRVLTWLSDATEQKKGDKSDIDYTPLDDILAQKAYGKGKRLLGTTSGQKILYALQKKSRQQNIGSCSMQATA